MKFRILNLRRRTSVGKVQMSGLPPGQILDGIELILDYIPETTSGISAEEEKRTIESIDKHVLGLKDQVFFDTDFAVSKSTEEAPKKKIEPLTSTTSEGQEPYESIVKSRDEWKVKYEATESKRRGLQLKLNEYKKKLIKAGIIKDESDSTTTEGTADTKGGKAAKTS